MIDVCVHLKFDWSSVESRGPAIAICVSLPRSMSISLRSKIYIFVYKLHLTEGTLSSSLSNW